MKMKSFEKFQRSLIIVLVAVGFFYGGYYMGKRGYLFEIRKNPPSIEITNRYPGDQKVDFGLFWDVWSLLESTYLDRPIDAQKMVYGAIGGMVESLGDPYTSFLPPEVNKNVQDQLNGNYQGIGAELGMQDDMLMVVAPLDGSPAKAAGLRSGDKILKVEEESTYGMTVTEAVGKIRGAEGTSIKLTLQTGNEEPREVSITRGTITIASVTWENKGDGTAYIRISRFGGETNKEWDDAVSEINIQMKELDAVIVDVRGNPGGYLQSAVHIAGDFFKNKTVVYQELATGEQIPLDTKRVGSLQSVPRVIVLIDGGSASASEIIAGALRDNIGATLVGTKSFGKGTIQDAKDFSDGSGVHITIAKWLTPSKQWVHKNGLEPDVKVEFTEEDISNGKDVQLEKAIELAEEI